MNWKFSFTRMVFVDIIKKTQEIDMGLTMLRDEITNELYELEEEYYHSFYKDETKAWIKNKLCKKIVK